MNITEVAEASGHVWRTAMRCVTMALALLLISVGMAGAAGCPALPPPYGGPIFDANVQIWNPAVADLLDVARQAGVQHLALFANGRPDARAPGMAAQVAARREAALALARAHPELVTLGAPKIGFIEGGDLPVRYVTETIAGVADGTYKFVGEILYTHGDKPDHPPTPGGEVYVDPLAPGTTRLLQGLNGRAVPLLTHWEAWAWDRDRPRFDRLYSTWPAQRFVVPSLVYGSPDKAEAILSAHPNVWGIISRVVDGRYHFVDPAKQAKLGPPMFDDCGVLRSDWRAVLIRHADRLMYGSDFYATANVPWSDYPRVIERYRRIAGQLPADVARRISWDTASALYGVR
jgi:hypothetical protein